MESSRAALLVLAIVCLGPGLCRRAEGQTVSADARRGYEVYAGYSFLSNSFNGHDSGHSHQPLNGWDVALSYPVAGRLAIKADVSGYYGTSLGSPQHPLFLLGGVQYGGHAGRETVFVEGLAGWGHLNSDWWGGEARGNSSCLTAVAGGGLDTAITARVAFRVQGDFQYSDFTIPDNQIHGLPNYFARIGTGVVWRF